MNRRRPLPDGLRPAFRVADARLAGASRKRLDAADLLPIHHGIRSTVPDPLLALVPAMGSGMSFCGPTAAAIWGLPLPRQWSTDSRLHVASSGPNRMRRPGIVASRRSGLRELVVDGIPVLDPASTWVSLGGLLRPWDLTAVADRIVSGSLREPALASLVDLAETLVAVGRVPGIRDLRSSLSDARVGSWSRPETLLRLLIVRTGLPEPVLNTPVALEDGRFAYPDLAWPDYRIAIEYDGRWHDSDDRRGADGDRQERLADIGWLVVRVRARALFGEPSLVISRLMRRLRERGASLDAVQWSRMPRFAP